MKSWSCYLVIALTVMFVFAGFLLSSSSNAQTQTLISENFSVSASNFSAIRGGSWSANGGTYNLTGPNTSFSIGNGNISVHNTNVSGDFMLTADASVLQTSSAFNDFSILFDYQDTDNYYFASFTESNDPNTSGIFRVAGGTQTQLADITSLITPGTTYAVKVERLGNTINVYRNSSLMATTADTTFTSGKVGFGSRNDSCTFDNLTVTITPPPTPAPTPTPPPGNLISEDFGASAVNFTVVRGGTWGVSGGTYNLTGPNTSFSIGNGNIAVHNINVAGDFTLTADASVTQTSSTFNDLSILFGYQDTDNYYFASLTESNDANTSGIFRVLGGTQTQIADITDLIAAGTTYAVRIERSGSSISVYRNNTLVAAATDASFVTGKVGFGSRNDSCAFDNLIVSGGTPPPTPTVTPTPSPTPEPTPTPTPSDDIPAPLRTVNVSTVSAMQTAITNAIPGDHIVMANGSYALSASFAVSSRNGTAANPIVVRAASVRGVTFTGTGGFSVRNSSYIIIQGFRFTGNGDGDKGGVLLENSNFCRVTRNYFRMTGSAKSYWTFINGSGDDHRIDHNQYANKSSEGCFVVVYGTSSPYNTSKRVRIDHNYFHDQTFAGSNGGEAIRFGDSNRQNIDAFGLIEYNLFENNTGDVEVISNKSSSNTIRYNTLRNNIGSIVLRHGDDNTVEGNFLLNGHNGIRFYGDNHKIIGNYFSGNNGTGVRSTLGIGNGSIGDAPNGNTGYDQPHNNIVAFNTLVANTTNVVFGLEGSSSFPATGTTFANNNIQGNSGTLFSSNSGTPAGTTWAGNILWGTAANGIIPASGYTRVNPLLVLGTYDVYRIAFNSPAIDASVNSANYGYLTTDIDGQTRTGTKDVGADEYSTAAIVRFPLTATDIGPNAP